MAVFTIDLLSGDVFLFTSSVSGGTSSGSSYGQVANFASLPPAATNVGKIYVVLNPTGSYVANRKEAGLYYSNGIAWTILDNIPPFFSSDNFQVYDSVDNTKGISFVTSGITAGTFRKIKFQNSDGTVAYLTDITTGVNEAIQLKDISGNTEVNTIAETPIVWTTLEYTGTSLNFTGGSKIYATVNGNYVVSYAMNMVNQSNSTKNVGSLIRKNGNTDITPTTSTSYGFLINDSGSNIMIQYELPLVNNDYLELVAFRIGNSGSMLTKPNGNWIRIEKIN